MKQIINKYPNDVIESKFYLNHLNQYNGLFIGYWNNGNVFSKYKYINNKLFGLDNNGKPKQIIYNL